MFIPRAAFLYATSFIDLAGRLEGLVRGGFLVDCQAGTGHGPREICMSDGFFGATFGSVYQYRTCVGRSGCELESATRLSRVQSDCRLLGKPSH